MATRGVLFFDLDGTIADSGAGIHASLNEVFESHDSEPLTIEELHMVIGPPLQESLPTLFTPRGISHELVDTFIHEYRAIYKAHHLPRTQFNDGMKEALEILHDHYYLAVVTAKPEPQALVAIEALGITDMFVTIVGPENDQPHPKTLLLQRALSEVITSLGDEPLLQQCWMIGDRHHDIEAGVNVGTNAMGVLWGFGSREELQSAGAHVVAQDPEELIRALLDSLEERRT
jgi:phosphoglycolate phosphatase